MKKQSVISVNAINPARPVTPTSSSLPPSIVIIASPTVPFKEPWSMDAAMTDFDLMVIYRNKGLKSIHQAIIMKTPITGY